MQMFPIVVLLTDFFQFFRKVQHGTGPENDCVRNAVHRVFQGNEVYLHLDWLCFEELTMRNGVHSLYMADGKWARHFFWRYSHF